MGFTSWLQRCAAPSPGTCWVPKNSRGARLKTAVQGMRVSDWEALVGTGSVPSPSPPPGAPPGDSGSGAYVSSPLLLLLWPRVSQGQCGEPRLVRWALLIHRGPSSQHQCQIPALLPGCGGEGQLLSIGVPHAPYLLEP